MVCSGSDHLHKLVYSLTLVEQPTIGLFAQLGYETAHAFSETFGRSGTLGRETNSEVVLVPRLRAALERLNPGLAAEAIQLAIDELTRDRSALSPANANREVYRLLKNGIAVHIRDEVYQHIYDSYYGQERSVYAAAS